jgi:Na+:H+ antiporter, NhaA family
LPRLRSGSELFPRALQREWDRIGGILRSETAGGLLLILAAVVALVWANSPGASSYFDVRDSRFGPGALHLHLSLAEWAADGLLALFFFLAGLELKHEFVAGDLREPRRAAVPVAAAFGGMIAPALLFTAFNAGHGTLAGWAVPTATDIAFSLAVLALLSSHLPAALRTFLLALAIVDDLLAIVVIAAVYTRHLDFGFLALALLPLIAFGVLAQLRRLTWWLAAPLAVVTWALVHASGVHSTVAGVLLAFTVPVRVGATGRRALPPTADRIDHALRPVSAGVAVPIFAFFASGVAVGGWSAFGHALGAPVTLGVVVGLVVGKPVGVLAGTWLASRALNARMSADITWWDAFGVAVLCGMGFTVSLLISELAYPGRATDIDHARVGVLVATLLSALLAAVVLGIRNRHHRRVEFDLSPPDPPSAARH